jgi:hypothetical protein
MTTQFGRKRSGFIGLMLGVILSLILGISLAVVHLVLQPLEVVKVLPKEQIEGVRYYVEGPTSAGRAWKRKLDVLIDGESGWFSMTEADLNAWSADSFKTEKYDENARAASFMLISSPPNFRIVGGELQMGLVNEINYYGESIPLVLQVRGRFVREGQEWRYEPSEAYFGGFSLLKIPLLYELLRARLSTDFVLPVEIKTLLTRASEFTLTENSLRARMP